MLKGRMMKADQDITAATALTEEEMTVLRDIHEIRQGMIPEPEGEVILILILVLELEQEIDVNPKTNKQDANANGNDDVNAKYVTEQLKKIRNDTANARSYFCHE